MGKPISFIRLIKQNALDGLLGLLKQNGHPNLPSSARTLLKTSRNIPTQIKSGMEYIYFSLSDQLLKHFKQYPSDVVAKTDYLEISINVDGLPLFKSSGKSLWPVLCAIVNLKPVTVFPVVLTFGDCKPSNLEFLNEIITDLGSVLQHGLQHGNKCLKVCLRCVVCDAPARALVKGTKLCSGYYGCGKCTQKGMWLGRVVYEKVRGIELRTDVSFRAQTQEEHHHCESPFCDLPIDMVKKFPIDYMHQLCLGVVKKLVLAWMRGNRGIRLSAGQCDAVSAKLDNLKTCIPKTFARKPRGLSHIGRWKATEYRQFLLYTGKLVLHGILRTDLYEHFLCLSIASCIMVSPMLSQSYLGYARQLMEYFVVQAENLYGREFLVYNVHSMIHLADEVEEYGSLDACSAFPFENYMQRLKRLVRSGNNPIVQIPKRLSELCPEISNVSDIAMDIRLSEPDNAFIMSDASCCEAVDKVDNVDENGGRAYLCRVYEKLEALFVTPCDSRLVGIYKANHRSTTMKLLSAQLLKRKVIKVDLGPGKIVFMAILHTNI